MRADDLIITIQGRANADGNRFFADVAVDDTVNVACQIVRGCAFLELTYGLHLPKHLPLQAGRRSHHTLRKLGSLARNQDAMELGWAQVLRINDVCNRNSRRCSSLRGT